MCGIVLIPLWRRVAPGSCCPLQVIYSTTSLWSAVLTMLVLRDETLGPIGWAGGAVIAAAGLVAGGGSTHGDKKGAKA